MAKLTDYTRYADAQAHANSQALWELFDGDREHLNIAHECITRHADGSGRAAVRIAHADGADEILSFDEIAAGSARFAHWLDAERHPAGRSHRLHAGAVAAVLSQPVRRDDDGRDQRAAVHAVRARRAAAARRRLQAEAADHQRREGGDRQPDRRRARRRRRRRPARRDRALSDDLSSRRPAPTTWRCSSTPPAPRANCRRR